MKEIPLTQGKVALVDDDVFDYLNQWKWCARKNHSTYYAVHNIRYGKRMQMIIIHRLIMKAQEGQFIDHENTNGLDNQKHNLRFATTSQNQQNQQPQVGCLSKYKGVGWHKHHKKWRVRIKLNRKTLHLGYFHNEIIAACVYDQMAIRLFREFARLNILSNPYVTNGGLDKI